MTHTDDHETALVRYASGSDDDADREAAAAAAQAAACDDCVAYLVQLFDQICALHDLAGSKMAEPGRPPLASLRRIDMLLDEVMILRGQGRPPAGGEGAGGTRAVSVGQDERS
jgi:hypothetical protein